MNRGRFIYFYKESFSFSPPLISALIVGSVSRKVKSLVSLCRPLSHKVKFTQLSLERRVKNVLSFNQLLLYCAGRKIKPSLLQSWKQLLNVPRQVVFTQCFHWFFNIKCRRIKKLLKIQHIIRKKPLWINTGLVLCNAHSPHSKKVPRYLNSERGYVRKSSLLIKFRRIREVQF